jgi:probable HAF family extracellular repeat protein
MIYDDPAFPRSTHWFRLGINEFGNVVGRYQASETGPEQAFLWDDGNITTFGIGSARDINERGQILMRLDRGGGLESFLYENGDFTPIVLRTGERNVPIALNRRGQVVGFDDNGSPFRPFLWKDGDWEYLAENGAAYDINDRGQVVGSIDHAFLWRRGKLNILEHPGCLFSRAHGINQAGTVVGYCDVIAKLNAVVWSRGTMLTLEDDFSSARDINDKGQIVGYKGEGAARIAVLWEPIK